MFLWKTDDSYANIILLSGILLKILYVRRCSRNGPKTHLLSSLLKTFHEYGAVHGMWYFEQLYVVYVCLFSSVMLFICMYPGLIHN